jgi:SPP1 family predicted phage head-tail adaptor
MKSSTLSERIEIQSATETQDAFGQMGKTWITNQVRWCSINPLNDREQFYAAQIRPETTHRITFRYFENLTHKHRLKKGSRIFDILSILNPNDAGITLQVDCVERVL